MTVLLADERCAALPRTAQRLADPERDLLLQQLSAWRCVTRDGIERLERQFRFTDFASALEFTNRIGALADAEDHHPAILLEWGRATVEWWTHVAGGLHRNDFIMAAKSDRTYALAAS